MIDRKQLKQEYKNTVHPKGVYAIRNTKTGRVFLAGTLNLYNVEERCKFRLNMKNHPSEALQKDWDSLGEGAFTIEVLETLPLKDDPTYDYDEDLRILEMMWVDKFRPLADKCYNEKENIRLV